MIKRFISLTATTTLFFGQCLSAALVYRLAILMFILAESISFAGLLAFWQSASKTASSTYNYSGLSILAYFLLAAFHHGIQDHQTTRDVGSDIRMGKLSYTLIRPYPYLLQAFTKSMANQTVRFFVVGGIMLAGCMFWSDFRVGIVERLHFEFVVQYSLALLLGLVMASITRIIVGLLSFDITQIWGPETMFIATYLTLSGSAFPIDLVPMPWSAWLQWTPMYYMVGFPTLTALERLPPGQFWVVYTQGLVVLAVLMVIGAAMWQRGVNRFEAIGI